MTAITYEIMALALEALLTRETGIVWAVDASEDEEHVVFQVKGFHLNATTLRYPVDQFYGSSDANFILNWLARQVLEI